MATVDLKRAVGEGALTAQAPRCTDASDHICRGRERGFTLIELLVVIVVLAILIGMLLPVV